MERGDITTSAPRPEIVCGIAVLVMLIASVGAWAYYRDQTDGKTRWMTAGCQVMTYKNERADGVRAFWDPSGQSLLITVENAQWHGPDAWHIIPSDRTVYWVSSDDFSLVAGHAFVLNPPFFGDGVSKESIWDWDPELTISPSGGGSAVEVRFRSPAEGWVDVVVDSPAR